MRKSKWNSAALLCSDSPVRRSDSVLRASDQSGAAFKGEVGEQPIERDDDTIAESDQKIDVRGAPQEPGRKAADTKPTEIDHGCAPADGRQIARVLVAERPRRFSTGDLRQDRLDDVVRLLLGGRSHP